MIDVSKISTQYFKRKVGTGSKRHDFLGEFLMIFSTSMRIFLTDEEGESSHGPYGGHVEVHAIASLGHGCCH